MQYHETPYQSQKFSSSISFRLFVTTSTFFSIIIKKNVLVVKKFLLPQKKLRVRSVSGMVRSGVIVSSVTVCGVNSTTYLGDYARGSTLWALICHINYGTNFEVFYPPVTLR